MKCICQEGEAFIRNVIESKDSVSTIIKKMNLTPGQRLVIAGDIQYIFNELISEIKDLVQLYEEDYAIS